MVKWIIELLLLLSLVADIGFLILAIFDKANFRGWGLCGMTSMTLTVLILALFSWLDHWRMRILEAKTH